MNIQINNKEKLSKENRLNYNKTLVWLTNLSKNHRINYTPFE